MCFVWVRGAFASGVETLRLPTWCASAMRDVRSLLTNDSSTPTRRISNQDCEGSMAVGAHWARSGGTDTVYEWGEMEWRFNHTDVG